MPDKAKPELRRSVTPWGSFSWGYSDVGADIFVGLGLVLAVQDLGVVPVPVERGSYLPEDHQPLRTGLRPLEIVQPDGVSFTLDGIYDGANPPALKAGDTVSVNLTGGGTFACSTSLVESVEGCCARAGVGVHILGRSGYPAALADDHEAPGVLFSLGDPSVADPRPRVAVVGTQIVATLIAVYGLFMTPLGWGWAMFVWGYALAWFLLNDRVKLLAYRIFDPIKARMAP